MASFEGCIKQILCGLSRATQNAIINLITPYIGELELVKASLEAELVVLDIATFPITAANTLAQSALNEIRGKANLIPFDLIGRCTEINFFNETIDATVSTLAADINIIAHDLERLVSLRDEVQAAIDDISNSIALFQQVLETFAICEQNNG